MNGSDSDHRLRGHLLKEAELAAMRNPSGTDIAVYSTVRMRCERYLIRFAPCRGLLRSQECEDLVSEAVAESDVQAAIRDVSRNASSVSAQLERALNRVRARKVRALKHREEPFLPEFHGADPTHEDKQIARVLFSEIVPRLSSYLREAFGRLGAGDRDLLSRTYLLPFGSASADSEVWSENRLKVALFRARCRFLSHLADVLPDPEDEIHPELRKVLLYLKSKQFASSLFRRRRVQQRQRRER